MTPEEASEKWCPFTRVLQTWETNNHKVVAASVNRDPTIRDPQVAPGCRCIADKCMAWRLWDAFEKREGGYCGLAGQPR